MTQDSERCAADRGMLPAFVYEDCVFDDPGAASRIIHEMEIHSIHNSSFLPDMTSLLNDKGPHFVISGLTSIRTARYMQRQGLGSMLLSDTCYRATDWLSRYKKLCLNADGMFLTWAMMRGRPDAWWRAQFGENVFLRPDSGNKAFPGQAVPCHDIAQQLLIMEQTYRIEEASLVLCAPARDIAREMRAWLSQRDGIVTQSVYAHPGEEPGEMFDVSELCETMRRHGLPKPLVVADFARLPDGSVRLLELNCAATSGVYAANLKSIINALLEVERDEGAL